MQTPTPALSQDGWGAPQASTRTQGTGQQPGPWLDRDLLPRGEPASQSCELLIPSLIPPPDPACPDSPLLPLRPFPPPAGPPSLDTTWLPVTCPPSPNSSGLWWPGCHPQTPPPPLTVTQLLPPQDAPSSPKCPHPPRSTPYSRARPQGPGLGGPSPQRRAAHADRATITVADGFPLWLAVRCRSCLSSGRRRSGGDPRRPVGLGRVSGSWGCACLSCWTSHISTPA